MYLISVTYITLIIGDYSYNIHEEKPMNKKYLIALLPLLLLTGCNDIHDDDPLNLTVACPSGAPALAFYEHLADKNLEISNANTVSSYFQAGSKDIVVLPTNAGVKMIQKMNAPYKIAATITFGNFYLAATGNDANGTLDKDDYIVVFQQNNIPDLLFKYVYGTDYTNIHYVSDAAAASRCLISGKNESDSNAEAAYVLTAQPALAAALSQNSKASVYADIQELYKSKTNGERMTQASIFVNNSLSHRTVKEFIIDIKDDIEDLLHEPSELDEAIRESGLETEAITSKIGNPTLIKNLLNNGNKIGLGFQWADVNKPGIDSFLTALGQETSSDTIYFNHD